MRNSLRLHNTHMTIKLSYWTVFLTVFLLALTALSLTISSQDGKTYLQGVQRPSEGQITVNAEVLETVGEVTFTKEQTVRQICHAGWNDLYRERMEGYGIPLDDFIDTCYRDLLAIATVETGIDCSLVGDGGNSYGCYQIHRGYHPHVTVEQAQDFAWATGWALDFLVGKGYPHHRTYAIVRWNGSNDRARAYAEKVKSIAKTIK